MGGRMEGGDRGEKKGGRGEKKGGGGLKEGKKER